MPTWGQILKEFGEARTSKGTPDFDGVRRKYLQQLHALTGLYTESRSCAKRGNSAQKVEWIDL